MAPWSRLAPLLPAVLLALPPRARAQGAPGEVQFDGARVHAGAVADAPAAATPASPQDAALLDSLLMRVQLRADSNPAAGDALRDALAAIIRTKTGGDLARAFVAENARASVGFGEVDGSSVVVENGIRVMNGSGGYTQTEKVPPSVVLNRDYLDTDPNYRRVEIARVLAHEMLGHGFERQRVEASGLSTDALYYYRADEGNASMVGWLVQAELGGKLINGNMWNYLSTPEKFYQEIELQTPYYATTLSAAQMLDPLPVWRDRLGRLGEERASFDEDEKAEKHWKLVIQHFVVSYGIDASRFSNLSQDIDYMLATYLPAARARLTETDADLRATIARATGPEGAKLLDEMRAAGASDYVASMERRMDSNAARLRAEVGDKQPETAAPPDPRQITWAQLAQMWADEPPSAKAGLGQ